MPGAEPSQAKAAPEHARRTRVRYRTPGLKWGTARWGRPLMGGAVGMAIVVTFLAVRGGEPGGDVNPLTGTARGGWNRDEDIVLALVAGGALTAAIAVTFLAEYLRHWTALSVALALGGSLLAIRELGDAGTAASDALLGLTICCAALAGAVLLADAARFRRHRGH